MSNYDYSQLKVPADYGDHRGTPLGRPLTAGEFDANLKSIIDHGDLEHVHQDDAGQVTIDVGSLASPIVLTKAEAKKGIIVFTGHLTANKEVRFPAGIRKLIAVFNATTYATPVPPERLTITAGDGTGAAVIVGSNPDNLILLAVDSANNNVRSWGAESMGKIQRKVYTTSGTFDPIAEAPGYENFRVTVIGAGGGGGGGGGAAYASGGMKTASGGGSGAPGPIVRKTVKMKGPVAVTIGAPGLGGSGAPASDTAGSNGTPGGTTSVGGILSLEGGRGGYGGLGALLSTDRAGGPGGEVASIRSMGGEGDEIVFNKPGQAGSIGNASAGSALGVSGAGGSFGQTYSAASPTGFVGLGTAHLDGKHGDGGNGVASDINAAGSPGGSATGPGGAGGGGGGGRVRASGNWAGGAGGDGFRGEVIIEWGDPIEASDAFAV